MMSELSIKEMIEIVGIDPKHPGLNDEDYIRRRYHFYTTSKEHRESNMALPHFDYSEEEHELWRGIFDKLAKRQDEYACQIYLEGRNQLGLSKESFPAVDQLSEKLQKNNGFSLGPAEGLLNVRDFFHYIAHRKMPCTQFLRHPSHPEYTPEPDAVHDVIGHVPQLLDPEYADLIQTIANGIEGATDDELKAWERIYWFTIEFGLIKDNDDLKAFGAGLLSSYGELKYCFSDDVIKKPFDLQAIINQDYDPTKMQDILFVIPSIAVLKQAIVEFIETKDE